MSAFKGDYLGFTYNGRHSSEFGIVRTSNGSRFEENLLPSLQDKTIQVPGKDGSYYFGSQYTQRQFNISFAFDSLREEQVSELRNHFGDKKIHDLIFDESPYKIYSAKVTGTATLKYIPFEEGETGRVYKGEGTIQFTCYYPFARSRFKFLEEYIEEDFPNKKEWAIASGMKDKREGYDTFDEGLAFLYNPGDIESNLKITIPFINGIIPAGGLILEHRGAREAEIAWDQITRKNEDAAVVFDSKTGLITNQQGTEIYNEYISAGDFFKVPLGNAVLNMWEVNTEETPTVAHISTIQYDYYYL